MLKARSFVCSVTVGLLMFAGISAAPCAVANGPTAPDNASSADPKMRAHAMAEKAIAYLRTKQDVSGGWSVSAKGPTYPAITGLVLQGMFMHQGLDAKDPTVAKGLSWLLSKQQPDGGIYDTILPVYNTAISLTALSRANTPEARNAIKPAQDFLKNLQYFEDTRVLEGNSETAKPVKREDPFYGGWGYGNRGRPDMSNTAFALEALHASGLESSDAAYKRAMSFMQRCQMDERFNDSAFAKGSSQGGFIYATSVNKDNPGGGQSFAGEICESLSGPPGTIATFSLKKDKDGKPSLKKSAIVDLLSAAFAASADTGIKEHAMEFQVLLGASSDGTSSFDITVRSGVTDPALLSASVSQAMKDHLGESSKVEAREVSSWRGESHLRAYGTMSYAGLKSYLYAGLSREDERVKAVTAWIRRNYTLTENPGVGNDGFYYYILMFGRAMKASGETDFETVSESGTPQSRNWRIDLVNRMAELQQPDGSFKTIDSRWMEDNSILITAYALIALESAAD